MEVLPNPTSGFYDDESSEHILELFDKFIRKVNTCVNIRCFVRKLSLLIPCGLVETLYGYRIKFEIYRMIVVLQHLFTKINKLSQKFHWESSHVKIKSQFVIENNFTGKDALIFFY